ncbi:molybdopterin-dependent oxidoreductase [Chloroflexota bacterium]
MASLKAGSEIREDRWVYTQCGMCYASCGIRVRVVDGVAVKIEGIPESGYGPRGGICGKALSQIQILYSPYRINYPLRRTNPEKGFGVDPKWKRISWDEALDELTERLATLRKDNPNKVMFFQSANAGFSGSITGGTFCGAYGSMNRALGGVGLHCGSASHLPAWMNHASQSTVPDYEHCNYAITFGAGKGAGAGHSMAMVARTRSDARARGMKTVAFDPMCYGSGGVAGEWIPILPGTDLAVCLAMANVLVNELGICDRDFLKNKTNAPYLIKPDGRYIRDNRGEPLMWDLAEGRVKSWEEPVRDPALEGSYEVMGMKCRPAFAALTEHLRQYTPEWAAEVSTVPAATIRRIAAEFGENARVGSTIDVQGVNLPYRPVAAVRCRAGTGHSNGFHMFMAMDLLNLLVGACEVPGGTIGWMARSFGYPDTGSIKFEPVATRDGHLTLTCHPPGLPGIWPQPEPKIPPARLDLSDVFTICPTFAPFPYMEQSEEIYQKLGLPYRPEAMVGVASNMAVSTGELGAMENFLKSVDFIAGAWIFPNETNEGFADLVFPDTSVLESLSIFNSEWYTGNHPVGMLDHTYHIRQPVVPPMFERRHWPDVLVELVDRLGMHREWNEMLNRMWCNMIGCPPAFTPDDRCSWVEINDRLLQNKFGPEHGLDWFKEHGFITWPKKVEEVYWRPFVNARSSVYMEFLLNQKEAMETICEPRDIKLDLAQYTPLPSWFEPVIQKVKDETYDLYAFTFKEVLHVGSGSHGIPCLAEISDNSPYHYRLLMNTATAKQKDIRNGDVIWVENDRGRRVKGRVLTVEGIHPQCLGMLGGAGNFARGQPLAQGRGACFNALLEMDLEHCCPISLNLETSARVKAYKAEVEA